MRAAPGRLQSILKPTSRPVLLPACGHHRRGFSGLPAAEKFANAMVEGKALFFGEGLAALKIESCYLRRGAGEFAV